MKLRILSLLLCVVLLCGCTGETVSTEPSSGDPVLQTTSPSESTAGTGQSVSVADPSDLFSERDYRTDYEESDSGMITLNGNSISAGSGVTVNGTTATITKKGTYVLTGTLGNGMVIVDVDKEDKVQLVLRGVDIHSEDCAPIYIRQADKVFITLDKNTENTLSGGDSFREMDGNSIDSVIFSKEDLTLNGEGSLTVSSPAGHGIVSKDELTITSGTYSITTASHGISGKDNVCIANASVTVAAGKDGIRSDNDEDETLGFVYIESGTFDITCEGDGISASSYMQLQGGMYHLLCGGGSVNGTSQTSNNWGGFGGGMGGMGGFGGGRPGQTSSGQAETDSTSIKGIKASGDIVINGGSYDIDTADDTIHSNSNVTVTGGQFILSSGDDGIHADLNLTVSGGSIIISECYEGLEGESVDVLGGEIAIIASDDGINAAGGTDSSGFGGNRGGDRFGGMGSVSANSYIHIAGGTLYINASGDGVDSNGYLTISGGHTTVCGPTQGDTAVLDYETTGTMTGGTFLGTGSYMMAQTFSSVENQGIIALSVGNQRAGTQITFRDSEGNEIASVTPEENYAIVIVSTPEMRKGETYTVTIGSLSDTFEAS